MKLGLVCLLLMATQAFATGMAGFEKRFELVKDDSGALLAVNMRMANGTFSIMPYLNQIKQDLIAEIERMGNKAHDQEIDDFIAYLEQNAEGHKADEIAENSRVVRRSLGELIHVKVEEVFAQIMQEDVLPTYEKDLRDVLRLFSLTVIANPNDARFFFKRKAMYEVLTRALEMAKKRFSDVPLLNLASFILVKVHDLLLDQRLYHQNMLLHYLQNFPEGKLGMTKAEADHVFSSVYESRIEFMDILSSNRAAANWDRFGTDQFFSMLRNANTRVRRSMSNARDLKRYNFGFVEVNEDGKRLVKNININKHRFSSEMSIAYDYSNPDRVRRTRALLNLAQVGLGFITLPDWLKSQVESFLESFYVEQARSEGALMAYFESNGNQKMFLNIYRQSLNPYLKVE